MSEATQTEVVVKNSRGRPKGATKRKIVVVTRRKEWDVKHFISISDAMGKRVT
jgi:hypothetical protein